MLISEVPSIFCQLVSLSFYSSFPNAMNVRICEIGAIISFRFWQKDEIVEFNSVCYLIFQAQNMDLLKVISGSFFTNLLFNITIWILLFLDR